MAIRCRYDNPISASPSGAGANFAKWRASRGIECRVGAHLQTLRATLGHRIAHQYDSTGQLAEHHQQQTYRPLPNHENLFPCGDASFLDGLHHGVHRLDEGGLLKCDSRRNRDDAVLSHPGHGLYILSEASTVRGKAGGKTRFLVPGTLGIKLALTIEAAPAWHVVKAHDAISRFPLGDPASNLDHRSRDFVPENLWRLDKPMKNFLDVCPANPASGHANQNLATGNFGYGYLLHLDASLASINARVPQLPCLRRGSLENHPGAAHVADISTSSTGWSPSVSNDTFWMYASRNLASDAAAIRLLLPRRISADNFNGCAATYRTIWPGRACPRASTMVSIPGGIASSIWSVITRIATPGKLCSLAMERIVKLSISTASALGLNCFFSSAVFTTLSVVKKMFAGAAP